MELVEFYATLFCRASGLYAQAGTYIRCNVPVNSDSWNELGEITHSLKEECVKLNLAAALDQIEHFERMRYRADVDDATVGQCLFELYRRVVADLRQPIFFEVPASRKAFWDTNQFDSTSQQNFPSAIEDMREAGRCFALCRYTALVFHSQRIVECGLRALADSVGVKLRHDWGAQLREIEQALEKRYKAAGARSEEDLFYSEAAAQIGAMKNAWRNTTMHVEKRYNSETAFEIFGAVRGFMRHIATRLREQNNL